MMRLYFVSAFIKCRVIGKKREMNAPRLLLARVSRKSFSCESFLYKNTNIPGKMRRIVQISARGGGCVHKNNSNPYTPLLEV